MLRSRRRGDKGAAAVEFALVMPVLLAIVFGIIEFGFAINRWAMVNNAAREGARMASLGGSIAEIQGAVQESMVGDELGPDGIDVTCEQPDGTPCANWGQAVRGAIARVDVSYTHNWITPLGPLFGDDLDIRKVAQMRIE